MQRTGRKRIAAASVVLSQRVALAPHNGPAVSTACEIGPTPVATADPPATGVVLSPEGIFLAEGVAAAEHRNERHRQLAIAIRQRIESRLVGRVRGLVVRFVGDTVVLEGTCATYYTKQLAQHAALAVLEQEQLENAIVVAVPR
ncbi:MAG: hypothetical protein WD669_12220 [Pirellulales bacterium]